MIVENKNIIFAFLVYLILNPLFCLIDLYVYLSLVFHGLGPREEYFIDDTTSIVVGGTQGAPFI